MNAHAKCNDLEAMKSGTDLKREMPEDLEDIIGKDVVDHILKDVNEGKFKKNEAEEFAGNLDLCVYGSFINSQNEVNFKYDRRAMKIILSDWFEKCELFRLTKEQTVLKLLSALRGAEKKKLAFDIEKMTKTSRKGESA